MKIARTLAARAGVKGTREPFMWIARAVVATSLASASLAAPSPAAADRIRIVASTSDLASIAREIGGDGVEVESIAPGTQDPHFVELLPSHMIRVRRAALYLKVGMDLDYWAQPIIDGSRNASLKVVDCSAAIPLDRRLEVPARVDASMGDVHKYGNPHYWLDPENGALIAKAIADGLEKADPSRAEAYRANLAAFTTKLDAKIAGWKKTYAPLRNLRIVTYHNSWPYFTSAFGIEVADWLEPKPGVKPSPSHISDLIGKVKDQKIALVAYEPYFESRTPGLISRQTGVPLVVLSPSVGGVPAVKDYFDLFEYNLNAIAKASGRSLP